MSAEIKTQYVGTEKAGEQDPGKEGRGREESGRMWLRSDALAGASEPDPGRTMSKGAERKREKAGSLKAKRYSILKR